jgi:hypothetical protein
MELVGTSEPISVHVHLGSTGCTISVATQAISSCSAPNRPQIELAGFDPSTDTVVFDYAALVAGIELGRDPYPNQGVGDGGPGCQASKDDPECGAIFTMLGLDLQTGTPAGAQSVFRAE